MEWMLMPLKRYADFSGRSRRKEYWMFILFMVLVYLALGVLLTVLGLSGDEDGSLFNVGGGATIIILLLFGLAVIIPSIAVQVRRFHDQDKSGWFVLLNLIPYLGGIIVLVFMCLEGTKGPNRYGPDPKGGASEEIFA
jgi:uncharacterized membrane protein YhaH (DUF805 family)